MNESHEGNRPTRRWPAQIVQAAQQESREIEVIQEQPLALIVNDRQLAVLMRLPGQEKELAAGFCVSEGLVEDYDALLTIQHCGRLTPEDAREPSALEESSNRVEVHARPEALRPEARLEVVRLIRAGCGAVDVARSELGLNTLHSGPEWDYRAVLGVAETARAAQRLHAEVGGVHAAALFDTQGQLIVLCEDIGRHNAVDKAIGYCLLRGIPLEDKLLFCSGRLSYEMVTKVIRTEIPVLASASAPTALAVELADRFNVTVVGYLRGQRMTVYTHPERLHLPAAARAE